jgi:exodeoxyribonuclease VII small subunit
MANQSPTRLSFEEAIHELEGIVRQLEEGKIPLEEAVTAYERGVSLKQHCEIKLQEAKLRVEKISISSNGEPKLEPFSPLPEE